MNKVLVVNHSEKQCGVYQFGKRVYELVEKSQEVVYVYSEINDLESFKIVKEKLNPEYVVYNWHRGTMPWLSEHYIQSDKKSKHYFIFHEEHMREVYDKYLFFGDYDLKQRIPKEKSILLPRPLFDYSGDYPKNELPTIGYFGFAFWNKGIEQLVTTVKNEFDNAVINILSPVSKMGDPLGIQSDDIFRKCKKLVHDTNLSLYITTEFLSDDKVLSFLAGNDINVFLYSENGEGISSVIDYALSVKRPIAISNCQMFRHILKDEIIVDNFSIKEILARGTKPLEEFYLKWSTNKFREQMDGVFNAK